MTTLNEEISQAIQKNMPAAVADELKSFITKAQQTETLLTSAKADLKRAEQQIDTLKARIADEAELAAREVNLANGLKELAAAQLKLTHESAQNRANVAEGKLDIALSLFATVFKNPELRTVVMESTNVVLPAGTPQPGQSYVPQPNVMPVNNSTTTITSET